MLQDVTEVLHACCFASCIKALCGIVTGPLSCKHKVYVIRILQCPNNSHGQNDRLLLGVLQIIVLTTGTAVFVLATTSMALALSAHT